MTGIEELRAIRRKGYRPEMVFVRDSDSQLAKQCAKDWHEEPNCISGQAYADIHLEASDNPQACDWRCLVGLLVLIDGTRGKTRLDRLADAILGAGASKVIVVSSDGIEVSNRGE